MTNPLVNPDASPFIQPRIKPPVFADKVHTAIYRDQWGRLYDAQAYDRTGHPVGSLTPRGGWKPPHAFLMPPQNHMKFNPSKHVRDYVVTIDMDGWLTEFKDAMDGWRSFRDGLAQNDPRAAALGSDGAPILDHMAGPKPLHLNFLFAMLPTDAQGKKVRPEHARPEDWGRANRWALGLKDRNGQPYQTPSWATPDMLATLQTYDALMNAEAPDDLSIFANDDEDAYIADDDVAETVERLDAASKYESLDDEPVAQMPRSHKKKPN